MTWTRNSSPCAKAWALGCCRTGWWREVSRPATWQCGYPNGTSRAWSGRLRCGLCTRPSASCHRKSGVLSTLSLNDWAKHRTGSDSTEADIQRTQVGLQPRILNRDQERLAIRFIKVRMPVTGWCDKRQAGRPVDPLRVTDLPIRVQLGAHQ